MTTFVPPARHFEPPGVDGLAHAAGLSRAHFSREFRSAFGESPHTYGMSPTAYRAAFPPAAASALVPACVVRFFGRPQHSTFEEDSAAPAK